MLGDAEDDEKPDFLQFWKDLCLKYPVLSAAALDIICSPMTEVTVERLFSHMSFILSPLRNRLTGEILEAILFLRLNNKFETPTEEKKPK